MSRPQVQRRRGWALRIVDIMSSTVGKSASWILHYSKLTISEVESQQIG